MADVHRIDFTSDKLGRRTGVVYYYKLLFPHRKFINELLTDFDITETDGTMLRRLLRTKEYSEFDLDRMNELRKMYIEDNG